MATDDAVLLAGARTTMPPKHVLHPCMHLSIQIQMKDIFLFYATIIQCFHMPRAMLPNADTTLLSSNNNYVSLSIQCM